MSERKVLKPVILVGSETWGKELEMQYNDLRLVRKWQGAVVFVGGEEEGLHLQREDTEGGGGKEKWVALGGGVRGFPGHGLGL